ncbi:hypothetical protein JAO29_11525 [Edaphobacter sp. HDX4]|uniref:hypothetical protein n=1 Tax=Edaphobacter sp. HDX4 TaxID=2794064 RepID=UPI002FE5EFB5
MKRFIVLSGIILIVLVAIYRERLFLRDPLAKVYRNGVRQEGLRVYINYSNDILVQDSGGAPLYMVQHWNESPGFPQELKCLRGMVCWTDHDHATLVPLAKGDPAPSTTMSDREVTFRQGDSSTIRVTLR